MTAAALPLDGFVVGVTADRRWEEQVELLRRQGAEVIHGPVIRTLPLGPDGGLRDATEALLREPPAVIVANTGIGVRGWLSAAQSWGLGDEIVTLLHRARVVARGPKAAGAVVTAGAEIEWRAPTGRLREVVDYLVAGDIDGCRVALQLDGSACGETAAALAAAGADVVSLPVYRWTEPDDVQPALRLADAICAGAVDAVTFTSAPAVDALFELAGERPLAPAFAETVLPVCIGPVCLEAAQAHGLERAVQPPRALLGAMVSALTDALADQQLAVHTAAGELEFRGAAVIVNGDPISLSDRERAVLRALARHVGSVVPKAVLLREVWGDEGTDAHALEVTVGRLRRRLGDAGSALRTVVRRGYVLSGD